MINYDGSGVSCVCVCVCMLILTFSPDSPFEEVKGSYCPGLCLNLYINKNKTTGYSVILKVTLIIKIIKFK